MNYKKIIRNSFSDIRPFTDNEFFRKKVAERAVQMENKKRKTMKRPLVAFCAVIAVLSLGVTAAAATGIINFNNIFGRIIRTEDEVLGNSLIGNAENVEWTTSDEDYVVDFKGVTGSNEEMIVSFEIARADGEPVEKYLNNKDLVEISGLSGIVKSITIDGEYPEHFGMSDYFSVNDNGNIEAFFTFNGYYYNNILSGKKITIKGISFYPTAELIDGKVPREKTVFFRKGYVEKYGFTEEEKAYLDSISVLNLEWSLEFTYSPSEAGVEKIALENPEEKVSLFFGKRDEKNTLPAYNNGSERIAKSLSDYTSYEGRVVSFTADSIRAELSMVFDDAPKAVFESNLCTMKNEFTLIKKDGTETKMSMGTISTSLGETKTEVRVTLRYAKYNEIIAVDISEYEYLSINGTKFRIL